MAFTDTFIDELRNTAELFSVNQFASSIENPITLDVFSIALCNKSFQRNSTEEEILFILGEESYKYAIFELMHSTLPVSQYFLNNNIQFIYSEHLDMKEFILYIPSINKSMKGNTLTGRAALATDMSSDNELENINYKKETLKYCKGNNYNLYFYGFIAGIITLTVFILISKILN